MRTRWLLCGVLYLLVMVPTTRAGLYLPMKPAPWPLPTNPRAFQLELSDLQSVALVGTRDREGKKVKVKGFAKEVEDKLDELEKRRKAGKLSLEEALDLSGCSLLMGNFNKAIDVLTPVLKTNPKHFMVLANLANAYQGLGEYNRAVGYQQQVLDNWPLNWPGWNSEKRWWYRRAEKYYLTLLNLRNREKLLNKLPDTLDGLFPRVPFADPKIKYLVGDIDVRIRDRLPPDVLEIAEQLLLYMPQDPRLQWMYAELLNARGEVRPAYDIMDKLRAKNFHPPELNKHHRELRQALGSDDQYKPSKAERTGESSFTKGQSPGGTQQSPLLDWRQLGVGFGSGLLVGILLLLQVRQLRRRFSGSQARSSPG